MRYTLEFNCHTGLADVLMARSSYSARGKAPGSICCMHLLIALFQFNFPSKVLNWDYVTQLRLT